MTSAIRAIARPVVVAPGLKLNYEPEYDLLSAWVGAPEVSESIEVEPGLVMRISRATGKAIGLEIMGAAERFHVDPMIFHDEVFARQLLERYGPPAEAEFASASA